jgi:hypothetical protein
MPVFSARKRITRFKGWLATLSRYAKEKGEQGSVKRRQGQFWDSSLQFVRSLQKS